LDKSGCQTLQTYTELGSGQFQGQDAREVKMFHVKQGEISYSPELNS
jgi:hypothetical protein